MDSRILVNLSQGTMNPLTKSIIILGHQQVCGKKHSRKNHQSSPFPVRLTSLKNSGREAKVSPENLRVAVRV